MNTPAVRILSLIAQLMLSSGSYAADVWFAPEENCQAVIVAELDKATETIDYQLYNATADPIGDALIRAQKRGVAVRMLLDYRANATSQYSQAARCKAAGIDVRLDRAHPIAHGKVRIIDGKVLLAGSFNDSRQANRNAENLTRDDEAPLVKEFSENFQRHWDHAETFVAAKPKTKRRR